MMSIERIRVTSRRPYLCSKTMERRPYWFVPINLHSDYALLAVLHVLLYMYYGISWKPESVQSLLTRPICPLEFRQFTNLLHVQPRLPYAYLQDIQDPLVHIQSSDIPLTPAK